MKKREIKKVIGRQKTKKGNIPIYISSRTGNRSIILYGIPGMGKPYDLMQTILTQIKEDL